jgi:SsrA-binding protein
MKTIATNRKAFRDYEILEQFEAGIELKGSEVKSLRTMRGNIDDAFVRIDREQAFLYSFHIPEYEKTSYIKVDPKRVRRLLLHKKEISRLAGLTARKGFTIVALSAYFNDKNLVKVNVALARGKKKYDIRRKIKEDLTRREADRALKNAMKRERTR